MVVVAESRMCHLGKKMVMPLTAAIMLCGLFGAACAVTSQSAGASQLYNFDHSGVSRVYKLYLPTSYDESSKIPSPLIFLFHGWSGDEDDFLWYDVVRSEADTRGYVLVAPRGLGSGSPDNSLNSWTFESSNTGVSTGGNAICDVERQTNFNYASCVDAGVAANICAWTQCQDDDVDFFLSLLSHLKASLSIDSRNVFVSGGSNGGMFTWFLGQSPTSSHYLRAIAPVIGVPHRDNLQVAGRASALPVILITGRTDSTVPPGEWNDEEPTESFDGDFFYYTGASAITRKWAESAGGQGLCEIVGEVAEPFDEGRGDGADCRTYCKIGAEEWPVVLDCRYNMGHDYNLDEVWPLVMDFFDYHACHEGDVCANEENKDGPTKAPTTPTKDDDREGGAFYITGGALAALAGGVLGSLLV
jgi:poly(3-hydroxybutyrate) depolymerase